ncbi:hypothetical protein C1H87_18225 [Flavivirga eckloniae]|uniref:DUF4380 domain-containing protein n=2 Tax=Flavivirga eckloniae TaxID=1803846 RepID=A0A2K9PU18_9FLAO|nr:hypothetical protein C1H87_18225 [Flavivirga eckloniae]
MEDVELIAKKTKIIELLSDNGKGRIAIAPEIQGKVLTTTYGGKNGMGNGWLNTSAFQGEDLDVAGIGGEDRVWVGPLGSQHSFYFQQIKPLNEANWLVPPSLSSEPYKLKKVVLKEVIMSKEMTLTNFIGTEFKLEMLRKVMLLEKEEVESNLNITFDEKLDYVAYQSSHSVENKGDNIWKKETGLISIWSAGMFEGTDKSVVIIPVREKTSLDSIYQYLGPLDSNRLQLKNNTILFKADGKYRSKIGIPHTIAPSVYGCYSKDKNRLTIVQYRKTEEVMYSNSEVSVQENPYEGEIIPIYNNGNMDYTEANEATFFELESTSAFVELPPNRSIEHYHSVYHFSGEEDELNKLSEKLLGISLKACVLE